MRGNGRDDFPVRAMIGETFEQDRRLAERRTDFTADPGLDRAQTKALPWDEYAIGPLIDTRQLWREQE